jgi:hypothetical protein
LHAFAVFCSVFRVWLRRGDLAVVKILSEKNAVPSEKIADATVLSH